MPDMSEEKVTESETIPVIKLGNKKGRELRVEKTVEFGTVNLVAVSRCNIR